MAETAWDLLEPLLLEWLERANHNRHQHYGASVMLSILNYVLGILASVLSASVVVFRLGQPEGTQTWPRIVVFFAAGMSGLQTFLNLGRKAETHRLTATGYAAMRRRLEETMALPVSLRGEPKAVVDEIRASLDSLAKSAPSVPGMLRREEREEPIFGQYAKFRGQRP